MCCIRVLLEIAAVSALNILGPSEYELNPYDSIKDISSLEKPPSGPISMVAFFIGLLGVKVLSLLVAFSQNIIFTSSFWDRVNTFSKLTGDMMFGNRLLRHCFKDSFAMVSHREIRFLSFLGFGVGMERSQKKGIHCCMPNCVTCLMIKSIFLDFNMPVQRVISMEDSVLDACFSMISSWISLGEHSLI